MTVEAFKNSLEALPNNKKGSAQLNRAVQKTAAELVRSLETGTFKVNSEQFEAIKQTFRAIQDNGGFNRVLGWFFPSRTDASAFAAIAALHKATLKGKKNPEKWKLTIADLVSQKTMTPKQATTFVNQAERHFILRAGFQKKHNYFEQIPSCTFNHKTIRLTFVAASRGQIKIKELDANVRRIAKKTGLHTLDAVKVVQFIENNKNKFLGLARTANVPQFIHRNEHCPRSVQFDPDGRIWMIFNRTKQNDRVLGKGESSKVTRAFDPQDKIFYARAVIRRKDFKEDADNQIRILKILGQGSSRIAAAVSIHPEYVGKNGQLKTAIIMKEFEGTLEKTPQNLTEKKKLQLACDLLSGLVYIHKKKVIHRDIKPENIFLETDKKGRKRAVIGDFNLACLKEEVVDVTGTPGYIAPEYGQTSSFKNVTDKIDVYSAGKVLKQLFGAECPSYVDRKMLAENPEKRVSASQALSFFKKKL